MHLEDFLKLSPKKESFGAVEASAVACVGTARRLSTVLAAMARAALLFAATVGTVAGLDCLEAGFTEALRCSSCAKLEALVPDAALARDCRACCAEDAAGGAAFARARLEICE
jgi:hypothetical protein